MLTCPTCGKENPDGFTFCGFCSAPLVEAATAQAEERKVVSVLFCDLVGFTARSENADPEDVRARLRPYHERLKAEIEAFGGTVEKFVGDAVMAVFGAPVAHEDDTERAVRAGLRILEAIEEMNEADPSLGLSVRIGVNTGETVVAIGARPERGEAMVAGDVVNTASRLQGAAPVGSIVVGETTHRATALVFEWEELEPVALKGKAEPTPIWRAVAARGRFGVDIMRSPTTPFIGREEDLSLLQHVYQRVLRERSIQLVTLVGEPGVGKSRLVSELFGFVDGLPELVTWRQGRCLPYGDGIAFWALGEIVKAQAGILASDQPEEAIEKLRVAAAGISDEDDRTWIVQRLGPLVGIEAASAGDRDETFTAWRRFLELIASDGPAVFVIEDLHWADPAVIEFLEHLVEWAEAVPMLVVCTARPELYDRHAGWGGGKRNTTTINVSPLTEEETGRLVQALLETTVLPVEVQRAVLDRAGGNPLYAEEFVRMLKDRGLLVSQGRAVTLAEGAEIPVPDTVQALIAARLDELTSDLKAILQDAAVVGKVFWSGTVAAMGERAEAELRTALHELSKRELIRPARISSIANESEFAFWHILVRDVSYGQIPRQSRITKHVAAARWIEDTAGERAQDLADVLVTHYWEALELARAVGGGDVTQLEEDSRRTLSLAAERARPLDVSRTVDLRERALSITPPGKRERPIALKELAGALSLTDRRSEAASMFEEAIASATSFGDRRTASSTRAWLAQVLDTRGDQDRATRLLDEALRDLTDEEPSLELAEVYATISGRSYMAGRYEEALELSRHAYGIATAFPPSRLHAGLLGQIGTIRLCLGDGGGEDDVREALEMGAKAGFNLASMLNNYADAIWYHRGPQSALEIARDGLELAERRGDRPTGFTLRETMMSLWFDLGRWDETLQCAQEVLEWADREAEEYSRFSPISYRVLIETVRGYSSRISDDDLVLVRRTGDVQMFIPTFTAAATSALASNQRSTAAGLLREVETRVDAHADPTYAVFLPFLVRAALGVGDGKLAENLVEGLPSAIPRVDHALVACHAHLAEMKADLERAAELYADAADRWESFPSIPERGYALLGLGRCELALGMPRSTDHLRAARDIFASLEARPLAAEVDALLGDASAQSS